MGWNNRREGEGEHPFLQKSCLILAQSTETAGSGHERRSAGPGSHEPRHMGSRALGQPFAGTELALSIRDIGTKKSDVYVMLTVAGFAMWHMGVAFLIGVALDNALRREWIRI